MPRQLDVAARRRLLLDAAWTVAARDGLDAVSTRAVAAEAGVSLGGVTRQYPQQEQLLVEVMSALVARVQKRLADLSPTGDPVEDSVDRLAQGLPLDAETVTEATVYYAFVARAHTTASLRAVADEVDTALAEMCRDAVRAVRTSCTTGEVDALGAELHALTEGLAFGLVSWPQARDAGQARLTVRSWLERIAAQ